MNSERKRILDVYDYDPINLKDITRQDINYHEYTKSLSGINRFSYSRNIKTHYGLPKTSKDAFDMLHTHSINDEDTVKRLKALLDFSNIAVKEPQKINIDTLKRIVNKQLNNFISFFLSLSKN